MSLKKSKNGYMMRNQEVVDYNMQRLYNKAITMFEWINLPPEIDYRYLEKTLIEQGKVCFFKDKIMGVDKYIALQVAVGGKLNIYNLPTEYTAFSSNGYHHRCNINDSVIIYHNMAHTNIMPILWYHARNIANIERTIEVNLNQIKRPYVFLVPESKVTSIKALFNDIKENKDLIVGSDDLTIDSMSINSTITPNNTIDLYTLKKKYYNEALTELGISNFSDDKKERLLAGEITSNEEDVYLNRMSMLEARKQACKQINEMFGLNVDVKFKYDEKIEFEVPDDESEVTENE